MSWDSYRRNAAKAVLGINDMPFMLSDYAKVPSDPRKAAAFFGYGAPAKPAATDPATPTDPTTPVVPPVGGGADPFMFTPFRLQQGGGGAVIPLPQSGAAKGPIPEFPGFTFGRSYSGDQADRLRRFLATFR